MNADVIDVDVITISSNSTDVCQIIDFIPTKAEIEECLPPVDPELFEPLFIPVHGKRAKVVSMQQRRAAMRLSQTGPLEHRRIRRRIHSEKEVVKHATNASSNAVRHIVKRRIASRKCNPTAHSRAAVAVLMVSSSEGSTSHKTDSSSTESIEPIWMQPLNQSNITNTLPQNSKEEFAPLRNGDRKWLVLGDENPQPMELNSVFAVRLTQFIKTPIKKLIEEWLKETPPPPTDVRKIRSLYLIDWLHTQLEPHEITNPDDYNNLTTKTPYVSLHQLWEEISKEKFNWFTTKYRLNEWLRRREGMLFPNGVTRISNLVEEDKPNMRYSVSPNEGTNVLHSCSDSFRGAHLPHLLRHVFANVKWRYGKTLPADNEKLPIHRGEKMTSTWEPYKSGDWLTEPLNLTDVYIKSGSEILQEHGGSYLLDLLSNLDSTIYGGGQYLLTRDELRECLQMNIRLLFHEGEAIAVLVVEFRNGIGWSPPKNNPQLGTTEILPTRDPELAYIHYLGVVGSCRGHGLAKNFISSLSKLSILLEVHNTNDAAISLYKNFGLSPIGPSRGDDDEWVYMYRYKNQSSSNPADNNIQNLRNNYPGAV